MLHFVFHVVQYVSFASVCLFSRLT